MQIAILGVPVLAALLFSTLAPVPAETRPALSSRDESEVPIPQMGDVSHSFLAEHAAQSYSLDEDQTGWITQGAWDEDHCSLVIYPLGGPLCFPGIPNGHHSWDPDSDLYWTQPEWWGDFGSGLSHASALFERAVDAYHDEKMEAAYLWLGRAMHLLGDMATPAHVLLDSHLPGDGDSYEDWLSEANHENTISWITSNPPGEEWKFDFHDLPTWEELSYEVQNELNAASQRYGGRDTGRELWELGPVGEDAVIFRLMYLIAEEADNWDSNDVQGEQFHGDATDPEYLAQIRETLFPILTRQSTALIDYFQQTVLTEPAPRLLSPLDGEMVPDNPPLLKWDPVGIKPSYEIEIDVDQDFIEPVITGETIATTFTPDAKLVSGEYFWRVRAYKVDWTSDWSEVWSFKVGWRVSMPIICSQCQNISPVRGEIEDLR